MTTSRTSAAPRPTAGALRLVEAATTRPRSVDIGAYAHRMTAHCPYLAPSLQQGLTTWTVYRADGDAEAVQAELFHAGAQAAEWLRPLLSRPHGLLRCENIVLVGEVPGVGHRGLLAWPHWVLKNVYGPVGVMFGKFYAGEVEVTAAGHRIPVAPASFLAVRAAVRRRDPRFLHATPDLAAALAAADDDGRDVFEHIPIQWKDIRTWARDHLPPRKPSPSSPGTQAPPARSSS
ncbi:DUF6875 domain-containing protein [Streptomyces drozdowiczii]|uniref:DUF6875 domain-containing protein n=1 Tax=Streptomyces drozdowiczii TaxID=202862 RepID=A0ABY6PV91_9ACTN|nr:hypothetical protein [Streptomyces drozdowiczii]MCX0244351.1 hypothetical protein [Streptomyces drozdowiczii]UZK55859.1 hypothetical protein NEH16_18635 [Streptomyces drozdowiczii]